MSEGYDRSQLDGIIPVPCGERKFVMMSCTSFFQFEADSANLQGNWTPEPGGQTGQGAGMVPSAVVIVINSMERFVAVICGCLAAVNGVKLSLSSNSNPSEDGADTDATT